VNPETWPQQREALAARLGTLRDELLVFAMAEEDEQVMERKAQLEVAIFNALNQTSWHARDLLTNWDSDASDNAAEWEHRRAITLARIVLRLVRGLDVAEREAVLRQLDDEKKKSL
jgi:hypothetical protein